MFPSSSITGSSSSTSCCCHAATSRASRASCSLKMLKPTHVHRLVCPRQLNMSPVAAAAAADDSVDSVLVSLREAFAGPVADAPQKRQQQQQQQEQQPDGGARTLSSSSSSSKGPKSPKPASAAAAAGRAGGGRRASSAAASAAAGATAAGGAGGAGGAAAAGGAAGGVSDGAVGAAGSIMKKRRGPFSELLLSLEHEQLYPDERPATISAATISTAKTSSTSASSNSNSSRPSSSRGVSPPASSSSSSTSSSSSSSSIRRIRRIKQPGDQQQQQQQHAATASSKRQQPPTVQQQQQQLPPWLLQQQGQQQSSSSSLLSPPQRRVKQYAPVSKGDLLLPGGPSWSGLRRHLVAAGSTPDLPTLHDTLVIVEGDKDQQAVGRAVNAPVYVCDGTRALKDHVRPELLMLQQLGRRLVVLTDPDERGRELRVHLDDILQSVGARGRGSSSSTGAPSALLHHAFVPEQQGTSDVDGPVHAAGNRGIEHVVPVGVQQALTSAKPSWPKERAVWGLADLQRLQLANAFDAGHEGVVRGPGGAAARRRQLCALLGLGKCSAAQLVTALNRFFSEEEVEEALASLEAVEEEQQAGAGASAGL